MFFVCFFICCCCCSWSYFSVVYTMINQQTSTKHPPVPAHNNSSAGRNDINGRDTLLFSFLLLLGWLDTPRIIIFLASSAQKVSIYNFVFSLSITNTMLLPCCFREMDLSHKIWTKFGLATSLLETRPSKVGI